MVPETFFRTEDFSVIGQNMHQNKNQHGTGANTQRQERTDHKPKDRNEVDW